LVNIRKLLGELITKSEISWLDPEKADGCEDSYSPNLVPFLDQSFDLLRQENAIERLFPFVRLEFYEVYADSEGDGDIFGDLYSSFSDLFIKKNLNPREFKKIDPILTKWLKSESSWERISPAIEVYRNYKKYVSSEILNYICELLFALWDDLEDPSYLLDEIEGVYRYRMRYINRRREIILSVYNIDNKILQKNLEIAYGESHVGWGTSWDKLLALEYLYKLNKKRWKERYFELIVQDLSSCAEPMLERNFDIEIAEMHLSNLDAEKAIDLLVDFFARNKNRLNEVYHYRKAINTIAGKNKETIKYFFDKVSKNSKDLPLDDFIEIIKLETTIDFTDIVKKYHK